MADGVLRLTKHHGAGNDFLVLLDLDDRRRLSGAEVRALCDRHRGIGADGVLRGTRPRPGDAGAVLAMELTNADGSPAEMSGNGIRCFVQAAVGAGLVAPGTVPVATGAGLRRVDYRESTTAGLAHAAVAMGEAVLGPEVEPGEVPGARAARFVDMGNPHLVVLREPVDDAALATLGPRLASRHPAGANVEFVWPGEGPGDLRLRVWERGVGETLACGTGACATAAAAASWGVVPASGAVTVHSPGGTLEVVLADHGIVLAGPTRHVADVELRDDELDALVAAVGRAPQAGAREVEVTARP